MSSGPSREFSRYQQKVIRQYYDNREQGDEQRLAELVSNLFLATGKKREKLWAQAGETMLRLNIPQQRVDHILSSNNPALIAPVVDELQRGMHRVKPAAAAPAKPQDDV